MSVLGAVLAGYYREISINQTVAPSGDPYTFNVDADDDTHVVVNYGSEVTSGPSGVMVKSSRELVTTGPVKSRVEFKVGHPDDEPFTPGTFVGRVWAVFTPVIDTP